MSAQSASKFGALRPRLTVMVGLPRSGKSTLARASGLPIVNPDSIRLALHGQAFNPAAEPMVWTLARYMVEALFYAGHQHVVLDATNVTRRRRAAWRSPDWVTEFAEVMTSKRVCAQRASDNGQVDLIAVIDRMARDFEPVAPEEGDILLFDGETSDESHGTLIDPKRGPSLRAPSASAG